MLALTLERPPRPQTTRTVGNVEVRPDELQVLIAGKRAGLTVRELELCAPEWTFIHTHFGIGYRFALEPNDVTA